MDLIYRDFITVEDYNKLRECVGWGGLSGKQAQKGIDNCTYLVAVYDKEQSIGMSRLIHDGGYVAFIADVIVHPDYQGIGIGRTMMDMMLTYLDNTLEEEEICMISLMAVKGKEAFYHRLGFKIRPDENHGAGMVKWIKK